MECMPNRFQYHRPMLWVLSTTHCWFVFCTFLSSSIAATGNLSDMDEPKIQNTLSVSSKCSNKDLSWNKLKLKTLYQSSEGQPMSPEGYDTESLNSSVCSELTDKWGVYRDELNMNFVAVCIQMINRSQRSRDALESNLSDSLDTLITNLLFFKQSTPLLDLLHSNVSEQLHQETSKKCRTREIQSISRIMTISRTTLSMVSSTVLFCRPDCKSVPFWPFRCFGRNTKPKRERPGVLTKTWTRNWTKSTKFLKLSDGCFWTSSFDLKTSWLCDLCSFHTDKPLASSKSARKAPNWSETHFSKECGRFELQILMKTWCWLDLTVSISSL